LTWRIIGLASTEFLDFRSDLLENVEQLLGGGCHRARHGRHPLFQCASDDRGQAILRLVLDEGAVGGSGTASAPTMKIPMLARSPQLPFDMTEFL